MGTPCFLQTAVDLLATDLSRLVLLIDVRRPLTARPRERGNEVSSLVPTHPMAMMKVLTGSSPTW
jgi:hypothetical protein